MKILSLVTSRDPFYEDQVRVLQQKGISVKTISIPGDHPRSFRDYGRFIPTILDESLISYDIVHANYGLTAPFAVAQPRRPIVVSFWGSDLLGKYSWLSKLSTQFSDAVIVMSEEMNQELEADAHVIPHGVDLTRFQPSNQLAAQQTVEWDTNEHHVLFPYDPTRAVKNYPRAERVVDRARSRVEDPIELHVVHDVPHEDMPTYMNAADVLLFTSEREGSPNTVKEALACNLPVVSTDVGDVRERLQGVDPSAVCTTDEDLVDSLVRSLETNRTPNGREAVTDMSLERMGERLIDVYRSVLEEDRQTHQERKVPRR